MKTRDEFIREWRLQMAGGFLYGVTSECKDGVVSRAARVLEIRDEVESMLGKMYDSLHAEQRPAPVNGHAQPEAARPFVNGALRKPIAAERSQ